MDFRRKMTFSFYQPLQGENFLSRLKPVIVYIDFLSGISLKTVLL